MYYKVELHIGTICYFNTKEAANHYKHDCDYPPDCATITEIDSPDEIYIVTSLSGVNDFGDFGMSWYTSHYRVESNLIKFDDLQTGRPVVVTGPIAVEMAD